MTPTLPHAPLDFQGSWAAHWTAQSRAALPATQPFLRLTRFHGRRANCQGKEKTLPRAAPDVSKFACVAALQWVVPRAGTGMLTGFPFVACNTGNGAANSKNGPGLPLRIG